MHAELPQLLRMLFPMMLIVMCQEGRNVLGGPTVTFEFIHHVGASGCHLILKVPAVRRHIGT